MKYVMDVMTMEFDNSLTDPLTLKPTQKIAAENIEIIVFVSSTFMPTTLVSSFL